MVTDLATLNDIEDIRRLRILYSHLLDSNDLTKLSELFTDDAICEYGYGRWIGRAQLLSNLTSIHAQFDTQRTGSYPFMHSVSNHWIELTGSHSAEGRCYLMCFATAQTDCNPLLLLAIYADGYIKRDGLWRINRSRVDNIWPKRQVIGGIPGDGNLPTQEGS